MSNLLWIISDLERVFKASLSTEQFLQGRFGTVMDMIDRGFLGRSLATLMYAPEQLQQVRQYIGLVHAKPFDTYSSFGLLHFSLTAYYDSLQFISSGRGSVIKDHLPRLYNALFETGSTKLNHDISVYQLLQVTISSM